MKNPRWIAGFIPLLLIALFAPPAAAQTRLALEVGPLLPIGDLADTHTTSLYLGARWEMQRVNPLGQVALLSFFLRGGYGSLQLDSDLEAQLESQGKSTSTSFYDVGAGMRVYSMSLPVFFSAGLGYAGFDAGGDADTESGVLASVGLGISKGVGGLFIEVEGRGNLVLVDPDNVQFITLTAGVGLPF